MRLNQFIAQNSNLSRRAADQAIKDERVRVNDRTTSVGTQINPQTDRVAMDGEIIRPQPKIYLMLHKPTGYVVSKNTQKGQTSIYELLPTEYHNLSPVGRLDQDSSGLLLLTNDGDFAFRLSHPKFQKSKSYTIVLDRPLEATDKARIERGMELKDGLSKLKFEQYRGSSVTVSLSEGRNRQIRRTFGAAGYGITKLTRAKFGRLELDVKAGAYRTVKREEVE